MEFDVLLPIRDAARTLDAALQSLADQTLPPTRILAIDDGSTDSTPQLLRSWQARLPTLIIERLGGEGVARALNFGLSETQAPWIARMDADDIAHPERFAQQAAESRTDPSLRLVSAQVEYFATDFGAENTAGMRNHVAWANDQLTHEELRQALFVNSPLPHPTWFVKQEAFAEVGPYDETGILPEDYDWLHRFFLKAEALGWRASKVSGQCLLSWRDHPTRLTRAHHAYRQEAFDLVRVAALEQRLASSARPIYVFGFGPRAKAFMRAARGTDFFSRISAVVDVDPRSDGKTLDRIPVWSSHRWEKERAGEPLFVINAVGTRDARENCERYCQSQALEAWKDFLSV